MRKKLLSVAIVSLIAIFIFTGCGGGSGTNQGGGSNSKPTKATLTVVVNDDSGNALNGAKVTVDTNKSKLTGSDGKVVFNLMEPGDYTIGVSKDGYQTDYEDVTLEAGDVKTVTFELRKVESSSSVDEVKSVSNLKSFKEVLEFKSNDKTEDGGKILVVQDNYGKEQHIVIYGKDNKVQFEVYVVGDKAKIRSGSDKWMEMPESSAKALTTSTLGFAEGIMHNAIRYFNDSIKTGSSEYSVKKVGSETVNGYPTYKYHILAKDAANKTTISGDIWIISRGPYKDYTTKMSLVVEEDGRKDLFNASLTDIGKDMHITLP